MPDSAPLIDNPLDPPACGCCLAFWGLAPEHHECWTGDTSTRLGKMIVAAYWITAAAIAALVIDALC
jgi:hypothetical protein